MKRLVSLAASLCFAIGIASQSTAQELIQAEAPTVAEIIKAKITESRPGIQFGDIKPSAIDGLYSVQILGGPVLYATESGSHFIMGDLFAVVPGGFANLAEQEREVKRVELMNAIDVKDQIVFAPKDTPAKAAITVFTDVDCFYCQKLHQEVPDLNRLGIEVRYMAFPRAGINSDSYNKIASAWCAADQQQAMTKLKARQSIPSNVCSTNPVAEQYRLGQELGVTGTPALLTDTGRLMPGYMPALQLARALGVAVEPELAAELAKKIAAQGAPARH